MLAGVEAKLDALSTEAARVPDVSGHLERLAARLDDLTAGRESELAGQLELVSQAVAELIAGRDSSLGGELERLSVVVAERDLELKGQLELLAARFDERPAGVPVEELAGELRGQLDRLSGSVVELVGERDLEVAGQLERLSGKVDELAAARESGFGGELERLSVRLDELVARRRRRAQTLGSRSSLGGCRARSTRSWLVIWSGCRLWLLSVIWS